MIELSKKDREKGLVIPEKMTPELAYLCGVFAGDGSIGHRPHKYEYELKCVGNPQDEIDYYHKILKFYVKEVFGFAPKIRPMDGETTYGFRVYSKAL